MQMNIRNYSVVQITREIECCMTGSCKVFLHTLIDGLFILETVRVYLFRYTVNPLKTEPHWDQFLIGLYKID